MSKILARLVSHSHSASYPLTLSFIMSSMASEFVRNYHWKSKGVTPWAEDWFKREIPSTSVEGDAGTVTVDTVKSFDGDAELGNRKAK